MRLWRRLTAVALISAFVALLFSLWHPVYYFSGLMQVDRRNEKVVLPALRTQPVALFDGGYDGQFYGQLACDPTLRTPALATAIDSLPYRARRILMPAVAWVVALGSPERAVRVVPWVNIVCWFVLAWQLWTAMDVDRRWLGVLAWGGFLYSAGIAASVRYSLTDLPALVLFVAALQAAEKARPGWMALWFGGSLLTRETMLVGAWGLLANAWARPMRLLREARWLFLAVLPLVLWLAYIRWRLGGQNGGSGNFSGPGVGLLGEWREEIAYLMSGRDPKLALFSALATLAMTAQVVFFVICRDPANRWWRAGVGSWVLMLFLGPAVWEGVFGAALRVLLPLFLVCTLMALRRRRALWWLLLFNLSVPAGLREFIPVTEERELATLRAGPVAAVLRSAEGCFGRERLKNDCWVWLGADATWRLRVWSGDAQSAFVIDSSVRAPDERDLVVRCNGAEVWRGRVGQAWLPVRLALPGVPDGEVVLTFHSDKEGVLEGPDADARALSVCFLNPRIEVER